MCNVTAKLTSQSTKIYIAPNQDLSSEMHLTLARQIKGAGRAIEGESGGGNAPPRDK